MTTERAGKAVDVEVAVFVDVLVEVGVGVDVLVAVRVGVPVDVAVEVPVEVAVGVEDGVTVGVKVETPAQKVRVLDIFCGLLGEVNTPALKSAKLLFVSSQPPELR
jgi:hypothetical protein